MEGIPLERVNFLACLHFDHFHPRFFHHLEPFLLLLDVPIFLLQDLEVRRVPLLPRFPQELEEQAHWMAFLD